MTAVAGPFYAAAGLLGAAGVLKLLRPASTARALRAAQLTGTGSGTGVLASPTIGRLLGMAEVSLASAALLLGGRVTAVLVTVGYLGFSAFTARLLRTAGAGASCGCFGADETPASTVHVAVNGCIALVGVLAVVWPVPDLSTVLSAQPLAGVPFLGLTVICSWLLFVLLSVVPELVAAMSVAPARLAVGQLRGGPR